MKEMENHLLEHLSIFDSWLKLYKAPCRGQFRIFRSKLKWIYWVISTQVFDYHDWNLQRIISKELSLSVKSKTKYDQLQLVNFYNQLN